MNRLFAKGLARRLGLSLACLTGLALIAPGVAAAADVALVIGNHDYRRAPDAVSAKIDSEAVAETLRQSGYEVITGMDLTRSGMRARIARFAGELDDADRVVVFYSGHALRTGGTTYLAPIDQANETLVDVMMGGVPLDLVLRLAGEASGKAVVFVDGAQLDGFTPKDFAEPGLAHIDPPEGVLVVSAAAPGRAIARRSERQSDFARQVIEDFLAPGNRIGNAVRGLESPGWVGGDTDSSLVLVPAARVEASAEAGAGTGGTGAGTGAQSAVQIESRLGLTTPERRTIQVNLSRLGYDTRGTEGIFGAGTRAAIRGWQRANDLQATGYLTQEQVALINLQGKQKATETRADTPATIESRLDLAASERSGIQKDLTALGFDTRGTGGVFGAGTRSAIRNWQRANKLEATGYLTRAQIALIGEQAAETRVGSGGPSPAQVEDRLALTAAERSEIQADLTALGYDTRGTTGVFGAGTRTAIRNWQRANDIEETGYLTSQQVATIGRQAAQADTGASSPSQVEASLNLTATERSALQENLTALGYDTRGTGGTFGSGTRTAIRNWQRANDFGETGYLTGQQVAMINRQARQAGTGSGEPTPAEIEARLDLTGSERSQVQEELSLLGFDTRGTDGVFGSATRTAIRNWQRANGFAETGYLTEEQLSLLDQQTRQAGTPPTGGTRPAPQDPAAAEEALGLTRNDRLSVEQRLAFLGFPPGEQDGFFNADTRWAIEGYQRSRGYPATGYLDRQTVAGIVDETQGARTGIVTGAQVLFDILRGLGGDQK